MQYFKKIINIKNSTVYLQKKVRNGIVYIRRFFSHFEKSYYLYNSRAVKKLALPDFLGIGNAKAGSTWLYYNLKVHPELFLAEPKELRYFDLYFHKPLTSYTSHFKAGSKKVKGEITPSYCFIDLSRISFIKKIMPELKLIFIMRNPVERAWSQALMNLVTLPKRDYSDVKENEFYNHFISVQSLKRGDYKKIISNWLSFYPAESLFVGFFSDITERPKQLLTDIFKHLQISTNVSWKLFPYNKAFQTGPNIEIPVKYQEFLEDVFRDEIEDLYLDFGIKVQSWRCN